jgi:regulator of RNase E activity RraA/2-keto-4-pentenoate hydratase/2-oxohepta-3-ene-1,7-dioic acid hydratase in catechol pathway
MVSYMIGTLAGSGLSTGKIVAVHLNYRSRAAERGRRPEVPSYFLKATSSLAAPGKVERPGGTELLGFEGEIALVIGTRAHRVPPEQGWDHVGWVTAANDLGLYDFRHADAGSNLRAKSGDGYTPVGPELLEAAALSPGQLRVRTWVNGALRQTGLTSDLMFGFGYLVADLSRTCTLEPGDIILTGTPAGASVAVPGDVVEVEVDSVDPARPASTGRLRTEIVDGPALSSYGVQPQVDAARRALAFGSDPAVAQVGSETLELLRSVAVATLSSQLRRRGLENVHVNGVRPVRAGGKFAGLARTLRYLPVREDLAAEHTTGFTAQKRAVEAIGPDEVLVMDARGDSTAGTIGDILALRAQVRGAVAVITDGAVRDAAAVAALDIPVFAAGTHPAVLGRRHVPWDLDVAIGCGGALVRPGDVVVGDDDGVLVIPPDIAASVAADAVEQERRERFITAHVRDGAAVTDLYPMGERWKAVYEAWEDR